MITRTAITAISLGLCILVLGCSDPTEKQAAEAKATAERKVAEERDAAEKKALADKEAAEEHAAAERKSADEKADNEKAAADKKAAADPPTIQDDLNALAGDKETTWELSKKDAQGSTIRLTFYRDQGANSKFGRLWVISDTKAAVSSFEFKVEEKDKRRFLNATEHAFEGEGAEPQLPYVLEDDTLRIAGGKASNREFGVVELKGEWKRAKK